MAAPPIEVHARRGQPLGMSPARFLRDYWQKRPLLVHGAFPHFKPTLTPDELAGLACTEGALARIVLRTPDPSSFRGHSRSPRERNPTAFAGSQTRTPNAARSASARYGASQSALGHPTRADSGSPPRGVGNDGGDKWEVRTGPFDDATFAGLPESHWTLLVQDVDKWDADTAALLEPFAFIPSWRIDDVMISYAVAAGGVGAHVDQYDVFLIQGLGQRRWAIDARPNPPTDFRADVELKLLKRFSPTHAWTLEPGDVLYLPPGVPHDGVAIGECMTFSIGMRAPAAGELLFDLGAHLAETLPDSQRFADPDLAPAGAQGEIDAAALRRARRVVGPLADALGDAAFADWFGAFITRYRVAQTPAPRTRALTSAALAARLQHSLVRCSPWSRFAWRRAGAAARLYVAGEAFDAPLAWARALASARGWIAGSRLLALPRRRAGLALLAALANAGHVQLRRR